MRLKFLLFLTFISCLSLTASANQEKIDSLINLTIKEENDSVLVELFNKIGSASYKKQQHIAKKYWSEALELAMELTSKNRSEFNIEQLSTAYNGLGIISRRTGNYSQALDFYQNCLRLGEEVNNVENMGTTNMNIGVIYRELETYDKAIEYYQKSLDVRLKSNDTLALAGCYNSFGILYRKMGNHEKALEFYKKSLALSTAINNEGNIAQSYNNIGVIHLKNKNYKESITYFMKAHDIYYKNGIQGGIGRHHANMSKVYEGLNDISKAIIESEKSYAIYVEMGRKGDVSNGAHQLSQLYAKKNKFKKSLRYYKEFIALRDSVYSESSLRDITQKEMKYEFDKQNLKDSLATVEAKKITALEHQQEINQQKILMYAGAVILLLVIVFSIVVFNRLKISNKQKATIERQKLIVEIKNKEITDSINYAKRIQSAILPSIDKIKEALPNVFVLYKPKDIVAGDFYWYKKRNNKILIAVADCTGHGVPGALVSVVCNNALNRALNDFKLVEPSAILDKTAELVIEAFKENNEEEVKDGMDISMCSIDLENNTMEFAGAINSLFYISNNNLREIKGDKQPIGQFIDIKPFTSHKINFSTGDKFYLFSDGYADQFGGEKGKKYMYKRFRELLLEISSKEFSKQVSILESEFNVWKKDLEQVDDVCVIGIEV